MNPLDEYRRGASNLPGLTLINKSLIQPAAEMSAHAFIDGELISAVMPNAEQRARELPVLNGYEIRTGLKYGHVYASSPLVEGFAIWLPSDYAALNLFQMIGCGAIRVFFKTAWGPLFRLLDFWDKKEKLHKKYFSIPHAYLSLLCVDPRCQGQGIGSRLIQTMLDYTDELGLPCCLDTQREKNVKFYGSFGFEVKEDMFDEKLQVGHWFMLRPPQSKKKKK